MARRRHTYTATAVRSGRWWAIEVPDVPHCRTQARRLADVEPMARDAIATVLDVGPGSFDVAVNVVLPDEARRLLDAAAVESAAAAEAEERARRDRAAAVSVMVAAGITFMDAGRILGVSEQRAHQLAARSVRATTATERRPSTGKAVPAKRRARVAS